MIDRNQFVNLVNDYFSFLENEYKFNKIKETINDNLFYDIEYKGSEKQFQFFVKILKII